MKFISYRFGFILLILFAFSVSCSKQGETAAAGGGTNGAGGSLARFAIVGNFLYIVDYQSLDVYDISNANNVPVLTSTQYIGFMIETIYPYKDKLFIGSATGMFVYSINDPKKPKLEGSIDHFRACDPVVANDSMAYVTLRTGVNCGGNRNILNVYDVRTAKPHLLNTINMKSPYGLGIRNRALYVCEGVNGMTLFDLADPAKPLKKKEFNTEKFYDVIPYQDVLIAYIEKGVAFYDIVDPLNPVLLSKVQN